MKINQSDLKEVYENFLIDRKVASGESCPSNEDLLSWLRSKLPRREKNRITDHIINCYDCAQKANWLLNRIRKEGGIIYEIKKCIDANYGEPQQKVLVPPRRLSWKIASFASALICLAAIAFFSVSYFKPNPYFRGGSSFVIAPVSPINKSFKASELKFVWIGRPNMEYYFVEVFDSTFALLWRSSIVFQDEIIPSNELLQQLIPKETYFWMVTGKFKGGNKVKSRLTEFRMK